MLNNFIRIVSTVTATAAAAGINSGGRQPQRVRVVHHVPDPRALRRLGDMIRSERARADRAEARVAELERELFYARHV